MKNTAFLCLFLLFSLVLAPFSPAADNEAAACPAAVSTFKVPGLDKALTKQLVKEISKLPGIISAKPLADSSSLAVTHETATTTAAKIGQAMQTLVPGTELTATVPAKVPATTEKGCATCPRRGGCAQSGK